MTTYFIAQEGQVTGPFAEEQLLDLWQRGAVTMDAQVMMEGTEAWVPIGDEINSIQALKPRRRPVARSYSHAMAQPVRSVRMAVGLSLLITGLGHIYAGHVGRGMLWLLAQVVAFFNAPALVILIWIAAPFDAAACARHSNEG